MYLAHLSLLHFKNYDHLQINLHSGVNVFTGPNGLGKTNLMDAIHYLCMCKSFLSTDSANIKRGAPAAMIQGNFLQDETAFEVLCTLRKDQKKVVKLNSEEYTKLADHVGRFPIVIIAPQDQMLIYEGSDVRRRFIDSLLSQTDRVYLEKLMLYNRILQQRNALLKTGQTAYELYEFYDKQLVDAGQHIYDKRKSFFLMFKPLFLQHFLSITQTVESADIQYQTQLDSNDMKTLLAQNFERDLRSAFTNAGIHKDDILFTINEFPVKRFASQGQQKSITIALKLAQFTYISSHNKPLLILDDIYDKLDEHRLTHLMQLMQNNSFGQVFITDTHPNRVANIFNKYNTPIQSFAIDKLKS
ncbi:MAG: DNA replication and repair protein RecF [Bacteroidia bacterium]|nr:DNA replication and repair protein RecF [Bacteroidia bacterium]